MKTAVIIPAAGLGKRMGQGLRKTFLEIGSRPVIARTLERFDRNPQITSIILVIRPEEVDEARELVRRYGFKKVLRIVDGGPERQDSVRNGLDALDPMTEIVLVHDGVRPLASDGIIAAVIAEAALGHGAVAAVPAKDTIKHIDDQGFVLDTPDRRFLVAAQTPQGFPAALLRQAFEQATKEGFSGTDEASLVERIGGRVKVVPGSYENIKITTPEDVALAEAILSSRAQEG